MARRKFVVGGWQPQPIAGGRGGGGDVMLEALMRALGLGGEREKTQFEQALELAKLQQTAGYQTSGRGIESAAEERLRKATEASVAATQAQTGLEEEKFKYQKGKDVTAAQEKKEQDIVDTAKEFIKMGQYDRATTMLAMIPGHPVKAALEKQVADKLKSETAEATKSLERVYGRGDPKELEATMKMLAAQPDVVNAVDWQALGPKWGGGPTAQVPGDRTAAEFLWNLPGAAQNIGKGIVNYTNRLAYGNKVGQYPYTKFTDPFTEVPKYAEALNKLGQGGGPAPTAVQAPMPPNVVSAEPQQAGVNTFPAGNYSMPPRPPEPVAAGPTGAEGGFQYLPGGPSAKPDYMYGIKTPLPMDVINRVENDPRYMSAEQQLLNAAMDWWNNKGSSGLANIVAPQVAPTEGGYASALSRPSPEPLPTVEPIAIPPRPMAQTNTYPYGNYGGPMELPQMAPAAPGSLPLEQLMSIVRGGSEAERLPWLYGGERWKPPFGENVPAPVNADFPFELLNNEPRPIGLR